MMNKKVSKHVSKRQMENKKLYIWISGNIKIDDSTLKFNLFGLLSIHIISIIWWIYI